MYLEVKVLTKYLVAGKLAVKQFHVLLFSAGTGRGALTCGSRKMLTLALSVKLTKHWWLV